MIKRFPRLIKRFPRHIKRFPRHIVRRPLVDRFPRPIVRTPNGILRDIDGFNPLYKLKLKPKDKFPELYEQLNKLKEKFKTKNRKLSLYCPLLNCLNMVSIETCICRCKVKCDQFIFRKLVGTNESPTEYIDDFIKLQRIVNILYGTIREKDLTTNDLEEFEEKNIDTKKQIRKQMSRKNKKKKENQ